MNAETKISILVIDYEFKLKERKNFLVELEKEPPNEDGKLDYLVFVVRREIQLMDEFIRRLKK